MGIFMLDCDSVTSVGSAIDSLASKVSNISSSVSSYDTSCEDGFDFNSAKSVIASNIEACSVKIQNTASLIHNVVDSHTSLQNSFVLGGDSNGTSSAGNSSSGSSSSYSSSSSSSSSYGNSGNTGGGYTGGGYTGGYSGGAVSYVPVSQPAKPKKNKKKDQKSDKKSDGKKDDKKVKNDIKTDLDDTVEKKLSMEDASLFDNLKEVLDDNNFSYTSTGYGMIGNRYVIACDKSIGEVGDSITITRPDGTHVDCIIGGVTENTNNKNTINFFVDDSLLKGQDASTIPGMLLDANTSVVNNGQIELNNSVNLGVNSAKNGVASAISGVGASVEKLSEERVVNSNSISVTNSTGSNNEVSSVFSSTNGTSSATSDLGLHTNLNSDSTQNLNDTGREV